MRLLKWNVHRKKVNIEHCIGGDQRLLPLGMEPGKRCDISQNSKVLTGMQRKIKGVLSTFGRCNITDHLLMP
jgi:Fe2+ transport system protein FeoA